MMRIITGNAKGVRLATLEGDATRPTTERAKEALFSMLQFDIEGRVVLDLFAGCGQLSLEALSRGAAHAVMIDKAPDAIKIIKTNALKTKLDGLCEIYNCDFSEYIRKNRGKKFDIVFIDPPYASNLCVSALEKLVEADMLKPSSVVVCETGNEDLFLGNNSLAEKFEIVKQVRYSRSYLTILNPAKE
ncbi:MAG: 16S rRNA (guanine(966)-N(2))-methyltransferase RsmD [Ruminococcaceae bacterium]|nr:16S rRNA (guanine(966)-N(2))-methyltransferase RsmD [Oscillospiraceae bacterium]